MTPSQLSFFVSDAAVPGARLQLCMQEAGPIPKQETITRVLNLGVRIPKGLMGWTMPSPHLANSGLQLCAARWLRWPPG